MSYQRQEISTQANGGDGAGSHRSIVVEIVYKEVCDRSRDSGGEKVGREDDGVEWKTAVRGDAGGGDGDRDDGGGGIGELGESRACWAGLRVKASRSVCRQPAKQ